MSKISSKKLYLLDMDGTLFIGKRLFEKTSEFLDYIEKSGEKYLYMTNNSSKGAEAHIERLAELGIKSKAEDFFTAVDAVIIKLNCGYRDKKIYVLGTNSFKKQLADAGFNITDRYSGDIDCLVCGFDTELTYRKIDTACRLVSQGVEFLAANPDLACPADYGFMPDCGSICQMITNATGKIPEYAGKPNAAIAEAAMAKYGYSKEETIVVGDRLYTDIACGINAGVDTALVLTGEATRDMLKNTEFIPTFVYEDIGDMLKDMKL